MDLCASERHRETYARSSAAGNSKSPPEGAAGDDSSVRLPVEPEPSSGRDAQPPGGVYMILVQNCLKASLMRN